MVGFKYGNKVKKKLVKIHVFTSLVRAHPSVNNTLYLRFYIGTLLERRYMETYYCTHFYIQAGDVK